MGWKRRRDPHCPTSVALTAGVCVMACGKRMYVKRSFFLSTVSSSSSTASSPHVLTVATCFCRFCRPRPLVECPARSAVCGLLVKFLVVSLREYTKSIAPAGLWFAAQRCLRFPGPVEVPAANRFGDPTSDASRRGCPATTEETPASPASPPGPETP